MINANTRDVAFKEHRRFFSPKPRRRVYEDVLNELRHEIKLMNMLRNHPNVVQIFGVTFKDERPILIVELGNFTLVNYFEEMDSVNWFEKIMLCLDVTKGLQGLHNAGIVHGDLKGENILVFISSTMIPTAKISDFGYSSSLSSKQSNLLTFVERACASETDIIVLTILFVVTVR